jgi:hypothetical protein
MQIRVNVMKMPPKETPWGQWNRRQEIIPGVFRVETAGHGGYWVDPDKLATMPEVLRDGPNAAPAEKPFDVNDTRAGWFEEDDDFRRVVLWFCVGSNAPAFPGGAASYDKALSHFRQHYPVTVEELKRAGFFDRLKPKPANPSIIPSGSETCDFM